MSNIIVMAFSPQNIVDCLIKKGLQRGGHGHPRTPLATPLLDIMSDDCCQLISLLAKFQHVTVYSLCMATLIFIIIIK